MAGAIRLIVVLSFFAFVVAFVPLSDNTYLTHYPFLQTHDAATGYLNPIKSLLWSKTQDRDLAGQLACGARAMDLRPAMSGDRLIMSHGPLMIDVLFSTAVNEVVDWAAKNTQDLIILTVSHCMGDGCDAAAVAALKTLNVTYVTQCSELSGWTYGQAKAAAFSRGAYVLAVADQCWQENWDASVSCAGNLGSKDFFSCYEKGALGKRAWDQMHAYINSTTAGPYSSLSSVQCLWQETVDTVVDGEAHLVFGLCEEEHRSGLNRVVLDLIPSLPYINLLEINNVCDLGPQMAAALRQRGDTFVAVPETK